MPCDPRLSLVDVRVPRVGVILEHACRWIDHVVCIYRHDFASTSFDKQCATRFNPRRIPGIQGERDLSVVAHVDYVPCDRCDLPGVLRSHYGMCVVQGRVDD